MDCFLNFSPSHVKKTRQNAMNAIFWVFLTFIGLRYQNKKRQHGLLFSPSRVKKTRQNAMNAIFRVFLTFIGLRNQNKNSMVKIFLIIVIIEELKLC